MQRLSTLSLSVAGLIVLLTAAFLRLIYVHPGIRGKQTERRVKKGPSHLVIVLGSGGHTAEMMSLLRDINPRRYVHRTYIVSSSDQFSAGKASEIEKVIQAKHGQTSSLPSKINEWNEYTGVWDVKIVPRARRIHQPLYTTLFSSLTCLFGCLVSLNETSRASRAKPNQYPDVIITNGPATAVMVIIAAFILKFFGIAPLNSMKVIYVESWARVRKLSLSGKVLLHLGLCDKFMVQWESLALQINGNGKTTRKRVEWKGFLVE